MDQMSYSCGSEQLFKGLTVYLADLNLLLVKLHNLHWNVIGEGFFNLHEKTQELYEAIEKKQDRIAEGIRAMGQVPIGSMKEFLHFATIREIPGRLADSKETAAMIIEDFECVLDLLPRIIEIAKRIDDECTISILSEDMCFFGKHIWMMKAYLSHC